MSARVDRDLIEQLLQDESLSFREVARRTGCSDWTVRSIARQASRSPDEPPANDDPLTLTDWCIVAGIAIVFFGGIWLLGRWLPPPDGAM